MLLLSEDSVIIEVKKPVNVEDFKKQFCMLCSVAGNIVVPSEGDRLWISVGSPRPLPLITLCMVLSQTAVPFIRITDYGSKLPLRFFADFTRHPSLKDCVATDAGWPNNVFDVSMSLSAESLFVLKLHFPVHLPNHVTATSYVNFTPLDYRRNPSFNFWWQFDIEIRQQRPRKLENDQNLQPVISSGKGGAKLDVEEDA